MTTEPRRTPIIAIILAPVILYLLVSLWNKGLVPLARSIWFSETVSQWRLDSDRPAARIDAIKDIGSQRSEDSALINELVERMQNDESAEVRKAAVTSIGQHGANNPLSNPAIEALSSLVLGAKDDGMLGVAIAAVGQSAANSTYPEDVIERMVAMLGEKHLSWLYPRIVKALGQVGAAQPLPDPVFTIINMLFTNPVREGERENLANAFTEIAKGGRLPGSTLDIIAAAVESEPNRLIRIALIYALAHAAAAYPPSNELLTRLTSDPEPNIVQAAEHGLRIIEGNRLFADKDALSLATDTSEPLKAQLTGLRVLGSSRINPDAYARIAALVDDRENEVVVATLGLFPHLARAPTDEFDGSVLIPALRRAMANSDPVIRLAAYGSLSNISVHRPAYLHADNFPEQLQIGASDTDPKIRVVVLVAMLRAADGDGERNAIIERGITDPDPYVRRNAVLWMGTPRIQTSQRQAFITQALTDPHPDISRAAAIAKTDWESRDRSWPIELWQLWQAGEREKVGMKVLFVVTVATPILICGIFLLYYMARLLTYVYQRRGRAVAVVLVIGIWAGASYGLFMLFFVAGFAGDVDGGELAILAGVLWGSIAVYTALGWGMHYLVRR